MALQFRKIKLIFIAVLLIFKIPYIYATHNRAGEIVIEQIGDCNNLTIKATITTYTKASSTQADRDSLVICWGDGTCETIPRINGSPGPPNGVPQGQYLGNDTKKNLYVAYHTYPGRATYVISMTDPNRNGGILNVNPPASDVVPFHIQTTYTFLNSQFQGCNSTPVLLQPPIDYGCVGQTFKHNPNAYDIDKDSLSYQLIVPLQGVGVDVPNYFYPDQIGPAVDNKISLNPVTGDFVWSTPKIPGEYNIAMIIVEYRSGVPIDTMIRDMQIYIQTCDNIPPDISNVKNLCVIAGDKVNFDVVATDKDVPFLQQVKLTALGGPFVVKYSPASFTVSPNFITPPDVGVFNWQTACENISDQPYSIVFKAEDNYLTATSGYTNLETVLIKVVGPPPLDLTANPDSNKVKLTWDLPYSCDMAAENYFHGFTVWRRLGSNPFQIDTCMTGLAGKGYTQIALNQKQNDGKKYYYEDADVEAGRNYCYRIVAEFAKLSTGNNPYNIVESLPSNEACVQINRDIPLLTNADVKATSTTNGKIEVRWSKPIAIDLDTLKNPGPYRYQVLRSTGIGSNNFAPMAEGNFIVNSFWQAVDTVFIDSVGLNTVANAYTYKVQFFVKGSSVALGETQPGSTVYLNVASSDKINILSWNLNVPWQNYIYTIYRLNTQGTFDSIGYSLTTSYRDKNLINGISYCYKVKSTGTYGIAGVLTPLFNNSQEICGTPLDTVPPCPPTLSITNNCNDKGDPLPEELFKNILTWQNIQGSCTNSQDAVKYKVYYRAPGTAVFEGIAEIDSSSALLFIHKPITGIAGCYYITAIDSIGNESNPGNIVCVDNCPIYILPNTFTPNGDNKNDLFKPRFKRFISSIDINIFNRWGGLVFKSNNPDINWNGTDLQGKVLDEGVYYYTCTVNSLLSQNNLKATEPLSGYIHIIRGGK